MDLSKVIKKAKKLEKKAEENLNAEVKNGLTKETSVIKKGNVVDPAQKHKDYIETVTGTRVGFNLGTTLNMENYESLRADIWISDNVQQGETVDEAVDRLKNLCEEKLNKFVDEYR